MIADNLNPAPPEESPAWRAPAQPPVPPFGDVPEPPRVVGPAPLTDVSWDVGTAVGIVAGFAGLLVAAAAAAGVVSGLALSTRATTLAVGAILSAAYLVAVGVVALLARRRGVSLARAVGLRPVGARTLVVAALAGAVLGRLLAAAWGLVAQLLGMDVSAADLDPTRLFAPGGAGIVMMTIVAVVLAPVAEEIVFRGVLLPALAQRWGVTVAIVGSAFVFSVIHLVPIAIPAVFLFALVLGWLFVRTRSLLVCIVAHALFNGIGLATAYALKGAGLL